MKKYILLILFLAGMPLVISTPPPPPDIQLISQDSEKQVSSSINIPNQNAVGQSTIYETNNEASYTIGSNDYGRISVTRTIKPSSIDYYLLNRNYRVDVLVSGIGRDLDDVIIKEKLDPSLQLMNFSKLSPQVIDPFDEHITRTIKKINSSMINEPISDWIENCSNSSYNNTFYIAVNKLKSKNCIEYSYDITSNIAGIFEILTTVRIGGNYSNWIDLTYPKEVEFRPPIFSMDIIKEKSYVNVREPLDVTYAISYRAGWSSEPILRNIRFKTSNDNTYSIRINNSVYDGKPIPTWFSPMEETKVNISVYYNQPGNNLLPGIFIESEPISSDTEIYVYYNWIAKSITDLQPVLSNIPLYLAVAFSLVSIYFSRVDIKIMRDSLAATKKANKSTRISCKKGILDCLRVYYYKIKRNDKV